MLLKKLFIQSPAALVLGAVAISLGVLGKI